MYNYIKLYMYISNLYELLYVLGGHTSVGTCTVYTVDVEITCNYMYVYDYLLRFTCTSFRIM